MLNENTASGQFNRDEILKAIKGFDKASGPDMSRAYLVMPPAMFDQLKMTVEPFEVPELGHKSFRVSYGFGLPVYRMHAPIISRAYWDGPKPIVWKDEVKPIPMTRLQLSVIIASLALIMSLTCSVFN